MIILTLLSRYWLVLTAMLLAVISFLSLLPLTELPKVPGTDKTHHVIAYAVLMLPTALRQPCYWLLIGLGFVAYGGVIELVQPYVNRYGEWLDFLANTSGVIIGALFGKWLAKLKSP